MIPPPASRRAHACAPRHPRDSGPERSYVVASMREHGGRLLVRLAGVDDRDAADALRGSLFIVDSDDLPPIDEPDDLYDHQLEGLRVRTTTGHDVGVVAEVLHTAGGELLAVEATMRRRGVGAVRQRHRHVGVAGRTGSSRSIRPRVCWIWTEQVHRHENRRRHDLPGLPRPAATIVAGQGDRRRASSICACTICGGGPTTCTARWTTRRTAAAPGW